MTNRNRIVRVPPQSPTGELAAALSAATSAALRGDDPMDVLRDLGDRLRSAGILSTRPDSDPRRLSSGSPGEALAAVPASPVVVPVPEAEPPKDARDVVRVFEHWRTVTSRPSAKLSSDRVTRIRARLREGYSVEVLQRAIDGCSGSPFHSGENEQRTRYDDLVLICRSGATVERFAEMAGASSDYEAPVAAKRTQVQIAFEDETRRLKAEAKTLLRAGKVEEYADAIRTIRTRSGEH